MTPRAAGPFGEIDRRALTAVLRERAHRLPRHLPARTVAAARLLPVLLHASFRRPGLDGDPPGVTGLRYHRRWSSLSHALGLPPPFRAARGRALVQGVIAIPVAAGLEALVLVGPDLSTVELGLLQERLEGIQAALVEAGVPLRAALFDPARLRRDGASVHRAVAFGALLAGVFASDAWDALEESRGALLPAVARHLASSAASPLAALALTLLSGGSAPAPLDALAALLAGGTSARSLSGVDVFFSGWAGLVPGAAAHVDRALRLSRGGAPADDLAAVLAQGRALALACAAAVRRSVAALQDRSSPRRWLEAVGPGMPRVVLPAVRGKLALEAADGKLALTPVPSGARYEVRSPSGALLGQGAWPVQAEVRALALLGAAAALEGARGGPLGAAVAALDPRWIEVARRLPGPHPSRALLVLPEAVEAPGARAATASLAGQPVEVQEALLVSLSPGRRPACREVGGDEAIRVVVARAHAGEPMAIHAPRPAARPLAARLLKLTALLRDPLTPCPVAIQAGGRVLVPTGRGLRSYALRRFASRPRRFTPDPDAPDLSLQGGERRGLRAWPASFLQCRVSLAGPGQAALLFADGGGGFLREVVPLQELERRLAEARSIVGAATPKAMLALRLADGLELAIRRAGPPGPAAPIRIRGELPFIEVEVGGERFGGRATLPWSAAAEALLAAWPDGSEGLVSVQAVEVTAHGEPASPLLALHASACARRRLFTHISLAAQAYRFAKARRREG